MTITIQEIIDGFKNKRDTTYRGLVCLNKARQDIYFRRINIDSVTLPDLQMSEYSRCRYRAYKAIGRMAAILTFGSDAGCAPNPHQELRNHLKMIKVENRVIKESDDLNWNEIKIDEHMVKAIELLDEIEG